ncbi:tyrosine-protein phosphatase [Arthrobacter sp. EH-1B-1]|jgi:protein-tyrosine phosphatase|uniref:Tyrosine-protein phosphatase n=1 Tax=Arthrobacter vasquezii TaxID=2977629 RepID=A0ABT6CSU4_9MICC|nr:tyrosine-protein phosphatase [Arthrobacter vasquezii]MDF9277128.1 tyrosine-protein phosphatase [Arthrobacter vasquezii]
MASIDLAQLHRHGSHRNVPWDGAVNARDLGGVSPDIKAGRLYRMGRHEWLTDAGWQQAYDDGVRTVVDLRNPDERGRRETDPVLNTAVLDRFQVVNCPTEDQSDEEFMQLVGPYLNSPEYYLENLRRWPEKIAAVVRAVAESEGAVVVHCAAGRDRTGMVTAVLLTLAGVDHEHIADDYALAVHGINEHHLGQETPHETPKSPEELHDWVMHTRAHLLELLDGLDAEAYLRDAGLSQGELDAVRAKLTF